jgi:hypothetical protein
VKNTWGVSVIRSEKIQGHIDFKDAFENKFFLNELVQKSCAMYARGRVYEGGPLPP